MNVLRNIVGSRRVQARPPERSEWRAVKRVQERGAELERMDDARLVEFCGEIRAAAASAGSMTDEAMIDGAAVVREAVRRTTGLSYFDVQILAGLTLANGRVAEMQTGEGKTIVAAIPAGLQALAGETVHVATPNAYLAGRDHEIVGPALEMLGVSTALLPEMNDPPAKRSAYTADVLYGTGYEFGFDYLRDQFAYRQQPAPPLGRRALLALRGIPIHNVEPIQTRRDVSVVDEIDSVLIDEAMTPLVISRSTDVGSEEVAGYRRARVIADELERGVDYTLDTSTRRVELTESGMDLIHEGLAAGPLNALKRPWFQYVEQALHARHLLQRDVDYVVQDGKVMIVDQRTGRIFSERSWRSGLHQAVEVLEGLSISGENESAARVTRQRFYQLYGRLCGMTGTAAGAEGEFREFYGLDVVRIPQNRPTRRVEDPDRFFADREAKLEAIVRETSDRRRKGQPVLIGTRTIEDSRELSDLLNREGIEHNVLNGVQDREEAEIVADAGAAHTVTIATNMAGRGTDVKPDERALAAGGLHVIGAERNESRRVDRQLAGRAARQGAPGSVQFFVSADDELIEQYGAKTVARMKKQAGANGECPAVFEREIEHLQTAADRRYFELRRQMVLRDNWVDSLMETLVKEGA